jgi:ribosomal protein S18 acetylase RimI-like enzyme
MDLKIRKFTHQDTEAYIHLAISAFADEWIADGMTPDEFAHNTRQMFGWKMLPIKLLTAVMGLQWEAFVAEVNGHIVGGGMYGGRKNRITITNLMVEPAYRRQGIGQALLVKRLERLSEFGVPFVTVKALETNQASLGNLRKQGFVEYYRKSVYDHSLPISLGKNDAGRVIGRKLKASDQALLKEIEKKTMSPFVIHNEGSQNVFFSSLGQKLYDQYVGNHYWTRAFEVDGATVGFLAAHHAHPMTRGYIYPPVIAPESTLYLPAMMRQAGIWMEAAGLESVKIEVADQLGELIAYLLDSGWNKRHTWIYLVKWLDEKAKQEFVFEGKPD